MANPAPTINQINAFNATQGTTIDFNIIGGTELVRSNRIYIYDLSDNSLICTHLYVSTESIHELPPNTDGSIVYESGKSSADFVNGAQYYAQIQTFTDTAGTQGGSGLSVAKMFWCLVDPTLTITAIPSTISTTSYNVSATYTDTSASVVSNIIQQYQFNLYNAIGSLLQSSGVVVGSGTQQGTSDSYDISYNFTGLNVGSSYYVTVEVTTTQGMNVIAQSGTFTVSIETPTLGEATVVNNTCDGYISVTSNLSSEYGGSGSGEIASFVTDSINNISSLRVSLDPIQDLNGYDAPWVGGAGKNKIPPFSTDSRTTGGITFTQNADGTVTANGTATETVIWREQFTFAGGRYIVSGGLSSNNFFGIQNSDSTYVARSFGSDSSAFDLTAGTYFKTLRIGNGETVTNAVFKPMMRLSTVSDATYAPYENICPISGHTEVGVSVVGKNLAQFRATNSTFNGITMRTNGSSIAISGTATASAIPWSGTGVATYETMKNGPFPAGTYTLSCRGFEMQAVNDRIIAQAKYADGSSVSGVNDTRITPSTVGGSPNDKTFTATEPFKMDFWLNIQQGSVCDFTATIQLELGSTATDYEPYTGQSYTTALGRTVYGGTLDLVSGELTVTHAIYEPSSLTKWGSYNHIFFTDYRANVGLDNTQASAQSTICNCLEYKNESFSTFDTINGFRGNDRFYVAMQSLTSQTDMDNWLANHSLQFVCELATQQTYQLTPQQINTLLGQNNVWSENGDVELSYHIPITNLLVKRQDVDDVSGNWLTLYSQPITQASDMDFTFIDFTNQYGKTYKYALVPLLTQTQSGVEVEVEGGYTVSDEVQSVFDGVFIVDSTGSQKCKANVGYGNVDMNQVVGSITPIGAKYPIVITNSQNQYHNGSISGTIVPDDYYFNGNLSRIDMVNKRDELEQFLTNKRAKIIKDWNGNIWLVMIMDNVSCTFNNNYGMGIVNFNTNWVEVGDPTNQQDLQETGLINVGGV